MRSAERSACAIACLGLALSASLGSGSLSTIHRQRYAMGTMFDIVVRHASRDDAERAIEHAMAEIVRLDGVMSDYQADSDLSRVNRNGGQGAVRVDASLLEVMREAIEVSRRSEGRFDVTIAPLLKVWKRAAADSRVPSAEAIAAARRCVGYEKIELVAPNRIRLHSDCMELDLGGIGKGYAVDRAMAILKAAGVQHATVNAGGSSIAAIGAAVGRDGWPVMVGGGASTSKVLLLRSRSMSTSQQDPAGPFGDIIDPRRGVPAESRTAVTVVAPRATLADALSTTLVMMTVEEAKTLLGGFDEVSALWIGPSGDVHASYRASELTLIDSRPGTDAPAVPRENRDLTPECQASRRQLTRTSWSAGRSTTCRRRRRSACRRWSCRRRVARSSAMR